MNGICYADRELERGQNTIIWQGSLGEFGYWCTNRNFIFDQDSAIGTFKFHDWSSAVYFLYMTFYNILLVCGRRYKNGPGLKYHYTHYNHEQETAAVTHHVEEPVISHPSTPAPNVRAESPKAPASPPQQRGPGRPKKVPGSATSPHNYCDFCLGDVYENKSTGYPEELLSCADCGRSGTYCFVGSEPRLDTFFTGLPA